jgi:RNA polymerase sigma factor (sigma-70 family)
VTVVERGRRSVQGTRLSAFQHGNRGAGGGVAERDPKPGVEVATSAPVPSAETELECRIRRSATAAMERYKYGDESAFRELYGLISPRLYRYLFRHTRDRVLADDLKQQTLLHMHQARARFIDGANVFPWMYRIARCLLVDSYRRSGRELPVDGIDDEPVCPKGAADERLIGQQLEERLYAAIAKLPESQQAALGFQLEGLTYGEIAEAIGKTESSVTSLLHRAKRDLARLLAGVPD